MSSSEAINKALLLAALGQTQKALSTIDIIDEKDSNLSSEDKHAIAATYLQCGAPQKVQSLLEKAQDCQSYILKGRAQF